VTVRRSRALGPLIAMTVVAAALSGSLAPARAHATTPTANAPSISLTAQPAWSKPGDDVLLRLDVHGTPLTALEVSAHVHSPVTSRTAFEQTVNGNRLGGTVATRTAKLADLPVVASDRILTLPLQDPAAARDLSRIPLRVTGAGSVYPVEIELRDPDSSTVLSRFVTDLLLIPRVAPPSATDARLRVGWLWRIGAPPATTTAGTPAPSFTRATAPGGRLNRLVTALETAAAIPVTMVPNPETVEAMSSAPGSRPLAERLRRAAASVAVLAGPYTTIDGPSLVAGRLSEPITSQLITGRSVLERELATAVDHTVAAPQPLDAPWLARLRDDAGTTRLVVDPRQLATANPADQFTPARPFRLETGVGGFDALEVNAITSSLLVRPGSDALRAQQVLAALTVIALEQPNRARGVVMDTPELWDAQPARVEALVAGLGNSPLLRPAEVGAIFDTVVGATIGNGRPYSRTLAPATPAPAPVTPGEYGTAESRIDALASMTRPADPLVLRLRHELMLTPASGTAGTGRHASSARLQTIQDQVGAVVSGVRAPASRTFRLTSRRATVPVSILNRSDQALSVRVRLESKKLEFPNGSTQTVRVPPGDRNKTLQFDVAARASGTFPVLVTLSSPDGRLDLQRSRYTVRSSVVSGVGLFLTLGAAVFLAAWWFMHWRRRRSATVPPTA
jgi:hypothetical protein